MKFPTLLEDIATLSFTKQDDGSYRAEYPNGAGYLIVQGDRVTGRDETGKLQYEGWFSGYIDHILNTKEINHEF